MNALEITGLKKRYGDRVAVDGITLTVPRGQFFGFLGPNGAGKSTTIHCITGIARYDEGSIRVFGTDAKHEYRQARRQVGLAPQEFNIDFFAPVRKLLWYVAGYYGITGEARERRVDELLERFELKEHANKPFRELSGGLKRRATLARALIHDPELLILDEPTAGVDVEVRHDLWRYLRELNEAGKTIMLTSHYLEEVELLCERIAIINRGTIIADGEKGEFTKNGQKLEEVYLKITKGENW